MDKKYTKQMKLSLVLLILFALLFLTGTFCDKAVAETLFLPDSTIVKFITSTGVYPLYSGQVLFLGALFERITHLQKNICLKTALCIGGASLAAYIGYIGASSLMSSNNLGSIYPSLVGNVPAIVLAAILLEYPLFFIGYFSAGKTDDKLLAQRIVWLIIVIMTAYIAMQMLKEHFARPRYRTVVLGYRGVPFVPWYTPFTDAKKCAFMYNINADEFHSFPSGHSIFSMLTICILPSLSWLFPKLKDKQIYLFISGAVFSAVIITTRIVLGAHYLSDVSAGAIIAILPTLAFFKVQSRISSENRQK